jgi:uncharacterized membrane protein
MKEILDNDQTKSSSIKFKYIIVIFIISWILLSVGALFKIQSWPYASEMLTVGTVFQVISYLLTLLKVAFYKDPDSFLNK